VSEELLQSVVGHGERLPQFGKRERANQTEVSEDAQAIGVDLGAHFIPLKVAPAEPRCRNKS
jgi:hypothetical protein